MGEYLPETAATMKCDQCGASIKADDARKPCPECGYRHLRLDPVKTLLVLDSLGFSAIVLIFILIVAMLKSC